MKMLFSLRTLAVALIAMAAAIFMTTNNEIPTNAAEPAAANPLTEKWTGPYGGIPPFDKVKVSDFEPALEAAMAENLAEIDAIANNKAAPTFENTIAAMEKTGHTLDRVSTIYGIWSGSMSTPEMDAVNTRMAPKLAAFGDKISQNEALFKRIEAIYNSPEKKKLTSEQQRLVWLNYTNFVRSGAKLGAEQKKRLSEINQALAGHFTKFSQNLLADESGPYVALETEVDMAGLSQSLRDAAAAAANSQ
ncbi:MAG: hypothetical protein WBB81_07390, partial [Pyrinomonadaceae bacterium]